MLEDVLSRIESRLWALELTAASRKEGLSEDAVSNMKHAARGPASRQGVSTRTMTALAPVLEIGVAWLLEGEGEEAANRLYVDPHRKPCPGDNVTVQLHGPSKGEPGPGHIKRLVREIPTELVVEQFSPAKKDQVGFSGVLPPSGPRMV